MLSPREHDEPAVREIPATSDVVIVEADFADMDADQLFRYWIDPALITQWWPVEAEIDARVGGSYRFSWPARNWHLRGRYTAISAADRLEFTWHWDHEPEAENEQVQVSFIPDGGHGARLTLVHDRYPDTTAGREARKGHVEGWLYFLERLQALRREDGE